MSRLHTTVQSLSPDDTSAFAVRLGRALVPGDSLLLSGGIGAGKSHFARALIASRLDAPEDIPSPTFTLVQTYETTKVEIWHADLYRLTDPDQIIELGLLDAFQTAITLVEWPDRLAELTPENGLHLRFKDTNQNDTRLIDISAQDARWQPVMELLSQ